MSRSVRDRLRDAPSTAGPGALAILATAWLGPGPAAAHGFGQRYDLPLPFSFYLVGAAAAIAATFVLVAWFVRQARTRPAFEFALPVPAALVDGVRYLIATASLVFFVAVVLAGFFGNQNPYRNIAPTLVWIIVWVGVMLASALLGNVWAWLNPWRLMFAAVEAAYRRLGRRPHLSVDLTYPAALGAWPAFGLLFALGWIELVDSNAGSPAQIACLAVGYSALTLIGMFLFGADIWLRHGEVFGVVFGLVARFAPIELRETTRSELVVRPFGAGLATGPAASRSAAALILLLLSSVLYDGFLATPEWASLAGALGDPESMVLRSLGLGGFWLLFASAYLAVCLLMSVLSSGRLGTLDLAGHFAFSLVPIVIGYHVAHYLSYLLVQGQYIIPLLSDPLGRGWDMFGTAGYRVDIAVVGARFAWYAAVGAVVVGHIIAVHLAHKKALDLFATRGAALRTEIPLTALMVVYTIASLTILAEPIVQRGGPAQSSAPMADVAIPEDAVLPEIATGALRLVGPGTSARSKLTFQVLGSAFHDGTKMAIADIAYAYAFVYRWSAAADGSNTHVDPDVDAKSAQLRRHLAGLRFLPVDTTSKTLRVGDISFVRDLFTIEVYARILPEDPERDALVAAPWTTVPWHVLALMEEAVIRGWAAFSESEAARRGIPWLDLARDDALNHQLATLVGQFEREGYRPAALRSLVGAEEARRRWAALSAFVKSHGHFLVANGPYLLKDWSRNGAVLEAFRDLTYPLGVGSFDAYATPRRGFVTSWDWTAGRLAISADIETLNRFQRDYRLARVPLQSLAPEVRRRAAPQCRFVVTDEMGRVVLADTAALGDDAMFHIDLAARLPAGRYVVMATVALADNVMNAEIALIPVEIGSPP